MEESLRKAKNDSSPKRNISGNKFGFRASLLQCAYGAVASMATVVWTALKNTRSFIPIISAIFGFVVAVIAAILSVIDNATGKARGGSAMALGVALGGGCSLACVFNRAGISMSIAGAVFLCVPFVAAILSYFVSYKSAVHIKNRLASIDLAAALLCFAVAVAVAFFVSEGIMTGKAAFGNIYIVYITVVAAGAIFTYLLMDERSPIDAAAFIGGAFINITAMTANLTVVCIAASMIVILCLYPLTAATIVAARSSKPRTV